jgi:biopolymer transport protein ExbD
MAINFDDTLEADDLDIKPGMNITPLIDVLLVLLVMLIITIPIQLHSVNMELPAGAPPLQASVPLVVRIDITADSLVLWDGQVLADRQDLDTHLKAVAALPEQPEIHVQAQGSTKYDAVAAVLTAAQHFGLEKIGVVGLEAYAH